MRGKCKSFCAVCQSAECTSVHVELDLENRIYAKNEKQFIMKLFFRRSNCTALKLALKFWKIIKWLVRFEQHTADKVAALFWEGRIYNAAGTRAESCSSLPIYLIYCTTCADLHMCNIKVKSTVRQTPVKKNGNVFLQINHLISWKEIISLSNNDWYTVHWGLNYNNNFMRDFTSLWRNFLK